MFIYKKIFQEFQIPVVGIWATLPEMTKVDKSLLTAYNERNNSS